MVLPFHTKELDDTALCMPRQIHDCPPLSNKLLCGDQNSKFMMFVYCGQEWPLLDGTRMINLYPMNASNPFKSASYKRTKWVRCGHLNAPYSHWQALNYSPTRYLHII